MNTGSEVECRENIGFGDPLIMYKHRLFRKDVVLGTTHFFLLGGIKLPFGTDDLRNNTGAKYPPGFQLGRGSFDFPLGMAFTFIRNRVGFYSLGLTVEKIIGQKKVAITNPK